MIDNFSIIFFGGLIIYTAYKAIKLDQMIPWFQTKDEIPETDQHDDKV